MNFFKERPLALALFAGAGAFSLFAVSDFVGKIAVIAAALLITFWILLRRKGARKLVFPAVMLVCALLSFLIFCKFRFASDRFDGGAAVRGQITEIVRSDETSATFLLRPTEVNGRRYRGKLRIEAEFSEGTQFTEGDLVVLTADFDEFPRGSDDFFSVADGICGVADTADPEKIGRDALPLREKIADFQTDLFDLLAERSDADTAGVIAALLFGNRARLSSALSADFRRIGTSHLLALSGLHLSILVFGVYRFLRLFRMKKRLRDLILILLTAAYTVFTGASPSILRAGFMLITATALSTFGETSDPTTNLSVALALILVISPAAAYDLSLWLSVLATFGILVFTDAKRLPGGKKTFFFRPLVLPFTVSVAANLLTLPVTVFAFGEISPLSIFMTVLLTLPVELFIALGILILTVGSFLPIGAVARVAYAITRNIVHIAASLPFAAFSCRFSLTKILVVTLAGVAAAVFLTGVRKKTGIIVLLSLFCGVFLSAGISTAVVSRTPALTYFHAGGTECVIMNDGGTTVYDLSGSNFSDMRGLSDTVRDTGILRIDTLVFGRLSGRLPETLPSLLASVRIGLVILPMPETAEEHDLYTRIRAVAAPFGTEVRSVSEEIPIALDGTSFTIATRHDARSSVLLTFTAFGEKIACVGAGGTETADRETLVSVLEGAGTVIFASVGHKTGKDLIMPYLPDSVDRTVVSTAEMVFDPDEIAEYAKRGEIVLSPREYDLFRR